MCQGKSASSRHCLLNSVKLSKPHCKCYARHAVATQLSVSYISTALSYKKVMELGVCSPPLYDGFTTCYTNKFTPSTFTGHCYSVHGLCSSQGHTSYLLLCIYHHLYTILLGQAYRITFKYLLVTSMTFSRAAMPVQRAEEDPKADFPLYLFSHYII